MPPRLKKDSGTARPPPHPSPGAEPSGGPVSSSRRPRIRVRMSRPLRRQCVYAPRSGPQAASVSGSPRARQARMPPPARAQGECASTQAASARAASRQAAGAAAAAAVPPPVLISVIRLLRSARGNDRRIRSASGRCYEAKWPVNNASGTYVRGICRVRRLFISG